LGSRKRDRGKGKEGGDDIANAVKLNMYKMVNKKLFERFAYEALFSPLTQIQIRG